MKRENLSEITRTFQIPDHFIKAYRKHILFRTLIFAVVAAAAVPVSIAAAGFSSRSPELTGVFCYLLIFAVAAYNLKIKGILFGKTWTGTIVGIEYAPGARRTSILSDMYFTDMLVKLTVIPSKGRPDETFVMELGNYCKDATDSRQQRALGLNESHEGSFEKNPFYTKMPYETGDRLLFLRGLRYPLRMRPDDYTAQNVVCPFCGDVFTILTDLCPRCRRKLIYTEEGST